MMCLMNNTNIDKRITVLADAIKLYNNAYVKEVRARSVSFVASPFVVDGPNGVRKNLPAGVSLRCVESKKCDEGYLVNTYLAVTTCAA